ncbi:hypothetical protein RhiirA4_461261 [Rhizophagus irregularis]|uniref:Uncharacterized protein n=1 Tax=Rhizophagus irregularis TaxID=588596 RepID=A0A2I1GIF1_9GLOM|nr:hypothetical protein RhiirA4_461261 [Rhizophagus irregularis]
MEKYIEFFHRGDKNNFIKQQAWDQFKKELCEENCIALRYVWYYEHLQELGLIEKIPLIQTRDVKIII